MKETPRADTELYSETYRDIYFCEEDGLAEGDHVFLKGNLLPERWENRDHFVIAETGFGTGLNFLATWLAWDRTAKPNQHLTYISFEKFPLTPETIAKTLERWKGELGGRLEAMLKLYPSRIAAWHTIKVTDTITLLLIFDDVNIALPELNTAVDAWFLDGFAPAKNPEMWSETVFKAMAANSHEGTTIASFTAAGLVKNGLRAVGFHIAKSRGYGRKRDMIYGRFLPERDKIVRKNFSSVAVIGGGLAGVQVAVAVAKENIKVDLYEAKGIGAGASGNRRGLFNPRFTQSRNEVSNFYASAYALFLRQDGLTACGSLHLLTGSDKDKRLIGAAESWDWHRDHMRLIDADEASAIAGVRIDAAALYLPNAGFVDPRRLCETLSKKISVLHEQVKNPVWEKEAWRIGERLYDAIVFANGADALSEEILRHVPLSTVRGQIAYAKETQDTRALKTNLCYGGYCSPAADGFHAIGSTFQPWLSDTDVREDDNGEIIKNLETYVPALRSAMTVTGARAALRVAAKDRFPVVGKLEGHENLFMSLAHGSHGLISTALAAQSIAAEIAGGVQGIPNSVVKALSPQRFALRTTRKTVSA